MTELYSRLSRLAFLVTLLVSATASAQLSNFSFSAIPTPETCTGNGMVEFVVSGTTPGATMVYSIYQLPNTTTPITVTSESDFEGLTAGNYLAVAAQSLNGNTGTQQQPFSIANQIEPLSYTMDTAYGECQQSMNIIVSVNSGTGALYEIMAGPETFPPQTSNVFNVSQGGSYQIRVTDTCGEALVQTFTFSFTPGGSVPFSAHATSTTVGCNLIEVNQTFTTIGSFAYPLQVTYTITPPGGNPVTNSFEVTSGGSNSVVLVQGFTLLPNQVYTYSVVVTDNCGFTYEDEGEIENEPQFPTVTPSEVTCTSTSYTLYYATAGTVTQAPDTYPFELPHVLTMTGENSFLMQDLPPGTYMIEAIDLCGEMHEIPFVVDPIIATPPQIGVQLGCQVGYASIYVRAFEGIESVEMIAAPASYPYSLPYLLNQFLDASDALRLSNLPEGEYTFHVVNTCGMEWDITVMVPGLVYEASLNTVQHCGSFDLQINYTDNSTSTITFWLQKYNPATGFWQHPVTGTPYLANTAFTLANALSLQSGWNLNLLHTGHMRVIAYRVGFSTIEAERHCGNVLGEFDILGAPVISDAYSFSCNGTAFDVVIDAQGMQPLEYRITTFNGGPYPVENGNSNLFANLSPGTYSFQVEDSCGNIVNRLFEISEPYAMQIAAVAGVCEGSTAVLSVPGYPFLSYSWYSSGNPAQVLSTTASLEIENLSTADLGTYYVHIFTDNPESCIDLTLEHTLDSLIPLAGAGNDSAQSYCGNPGILNLSEFLNGDFAAGGTWAENTASGTLDGEVWDASEVDPGTYVFVYSQSSECGNDLSIHSFTINPAPGNPVAFIEQDPCVLGDLQLLSTTVPGATYQWTGPDGFSSSEQNPVIPNATSANNGTYTVQAFIGECASEVSSLEIMLAELPEVSISAECSDARMLLTAVGNTEGLNYSWSGPNDYSSSQNPADITGNAPGEYWLTVSNQAGCSFTVSRTISATLCQIPKGISANADGANDSWNLGGFGENLKVKIFNRYGMVVYEMDNYVDQWHGQCKDGSLLPSATYYYYIQNAAGEEKTGWVYLMRKS